METKDKGLEQTEYGSRITSLEREVHGLNTKMGKIESSTIATHDRVDRMSDSLDRFIHGQAEKPTAITPQMVMSLIAGVTVAISGLLYGIAQFNSMAMEARISGVDYAIASIKGDLTAHQSGYELEIQKAETFRKETHYEVAQLHAMKEEIKERWHNEDRIDAHTDELRHILEATVTENKVDIGRMMEHIEALSFHLKRHIDIPAHTPVK
jgi:hypothetical protein